MSYKVSDLCKTPEFKAAFEALKALEPLGGIDLMQRALDQVAGPILKSEYEESFGKWATGSWCWQRVVGRRRKFMEDARMPADDHVELRHKNGKYTYISQPYWLRLEDLEEIVKICRSSGMDVTIGGLSHHFVSACLRVVYHRPTDLELSE